jgi:hypothetical protein
MQISRDSAIDGAPAAHGADTQQQQQQQQQQ